jgi:hypothetical protein
MCCGNENIIPIGSITTNCLNPVAYIVGLAVRESESSGVAVGTVLTNILTEGFVSKKDGLLCCPNCVDDAGLYFLGNLTSLNLLVTSLTSWPSFTGDIPCCTTYQASLTSSVDIEELLDQIQNSIECCDTLLFTELKTLFEKYPSFTDLLNLGVVEISTLNGLTSLNQIVNLILEEKPYADEEYIHSILISLLTTGVVIKCNDCKISIGIPENVVSIMNILL